MYQGGSVDSGKVTLGLPGSKVFAKQRIGQAPSISASKTRPCFPATATPAPSRHAAIRHPLSCSHMRRPKAPHVMAARLALDDGEGAPPSTRMLAPVM